MHALIQKSEIIAITYSAVVKQTFKIATSNADCNRRLFAMYLTLYIVVSKSA
jgi:hypothetical protein